VVYVVVVVVAASLPSWVGGTSFLHCVYIIVNG